MWKLNITHSHNRRISYRISIVLSCNECHMISRHIIKWKIPICYSTPANKIIISVVCCTQSNKHLFAKWRCSNVNIITIAHFYSFLSGIHQINRRNSVLVSIWWASSHCCLFRLNIYSISSLSHFRYKQTVKEICLSGSILLSHQCNESTCTFASRRKNQVNINCIERFVWAKQLFAA